MYCSLTASFSHKMIQYSSKRYLIVSRTHIMDGNDMVAKFAKQRTDTHHWSRTLLWRLKRPAQEGTSRLRCKEKRLIFGENQPDKHRRRNLSTAYQMVITNF